MAERKKGDPAPAKAYGEAIQKGETTIITVTDVSTEYKRTGLGTTDRSHARPFGYLEITSEGVQFRQVNPPPTNLISALQAGILVSLVITAGSVLNAIIEAFTRIKIVQSRQNRPKLGFQPPKPSDKKS